MKELLLNIQLVYYIYVRKSTDVEDKQVLSVEAQIVELRKFAADNNMKIAGVIVEKQSAKTPGRKKFNTMMKDIEAGKANGILSWHPDRLARNSVDGGHIIYLLDEMRLDKSAEEIQLMQIASNISAEAHTRAMQSVRPNMMEYALEAELNYIFGKNGCVPSYNSIVGGGENGCILHYVENNKVLKDGDLVLIDAACEYELYASDITRTFPVNGKFSPEQKALYQVVLDSQIAAIDAVKIGNSYKEPHHIAVQILVQGLLDLGIMQGDLEDIIETESYRQFYMHGTGHWLGMDVHDVGTYKHGDDWRVYEEGMVVTVEPGLYIAPDDESVAEKWRGIGIRIEDDVVATVNGPLVLTKNVVKSVEDIEALMAEFR